MWLRRKERKIISSSMDGSCHHLLTCGHGGDLPAKSRSTVAAKTQAGFKKEVK
jgi:hypothetical protein